MDTDDDSELSLGEQVGQTRVKKIYESDDDSEASGDVGDGASLSGSSEQEFRPEFGAFSRVQIGGDSRDPHEKAILLMIEALDRRPSLKSRIDEGVIRSMSGIVNLELMNPDVFVCALAFVRAKEKLTQDNFSKFATEINKKIDATHKVSSVDLLRYIRFLKK